MKRHGVQKFTLQVALGGIFLVGTHTAQANACAARPAKMEAQMEALARGGGACAKAYFENRELMVAAVEHARALRHAECAQAVVSASALFYRIALPQGDVPAVLHSINTLLARDATHPQATCAWLLIAGMAGPLSFAKAYARFKAAASAHPGDVHVLSGCGVLALNLAQERNDDKTMFRECLQWHTRALALNAPTAEKDILYNTAKAHEYVGEYEAAITLYRLYLAGAPKDERRVPEAWYSLGYTLLVILPPGDAAGGGGNDDDSFRQVAECYYKGVEAEGHRLPVWGPVTAQGKPLLAMVLQARGISSAGAGNGTPARRGWPQQPQPPESPSCCGACGKPGAPSRCGRCKVVSYCNAACQRLDWASHKKGGCTDRRGAPGKE